MIQFMHKHVMKLLMQRPSFFLKQIEIFEQNMHLPSSENLKYSQPNLL